MPERHFERHLPEIYLPEGGTPEGHMPEGGLLKVIANGPSYTDICQSDSCHMPERQLQAVEHHILFEMKNNSRKSSCMKMLKT